MRVTLEITRLKSTGRERWPIRICRRSPKKLRFTQRLRRRWTSSAGDRIDWKDRRAVYLRGDGGQIQSRFASIREHISVADEMSNRSPRRLIHRCAHRAMHVRFGSSTTTATWPVLENSWSVGKEMIIDDIPDEKRSCHKSTPPAFQFFPVARYPPRVFPYHPTR